MNLLVNSLVFRRMTYADFRHINKIGGEEAGGGGQSYIDFPISDISVADWFEFLGKNTGTRTNGPFWNFDIKSIATNNNQEITIYQRRPASVSIASQKIHSSRSNRVMSWHPDNGFPTEYDPNLNNLIIFIIKTISGEFWAGWFLQQEPPRGWFMTDTLRKLFRQDAGYLKFESEIFIDTSNANWPFNNNNETDIYAENTEKNKITDFANEDTSPRLEMLLNEGNIPESVIKTLKIRQRNTKIVKELKKLYNGKCQISGYDLTFKKTNGEWYSEVHHLLPLGEDGSDSLSNAIVVSPLVHRMLHYATVSEIDLNKIVDDELEIFISGEKKIIKWHPDHANIIKSILETD